MTKLTPGRFFAFALLTGLFLGGGCAQESSLPDGLDDPELLPAAVRANPTAFCQAALERHGPFAPDLVGRVGAMQSQPHGDFPPTERATCFFSVTTGETALVVFEARCADPEDSTCIIPLGISTGREGWIDPQYYEEVQRHGRVRRIQAPTQGAEQ